MTHIPSATSTRYAPFSGIRTTIAAAATLVSVATRVPNPTQLNLHPPRWPTRARRLPPKGIGFVGGGGAGRAKLG
ncbi:MAG UNVERIFIED_CONTAM: hypothetical protein LVR18_16600 [Planctomycetaceae bacterium]